MSSQKWAIGNGQWTMDHLHLHLGRRYVFGVEY